jgi:hypothetical protein
MCSNLHDEYDEFMWKNMAKDQAPHISTPLIMHHFMPKVDPNKLFKKWYAQCIVETSQPFTVSLHHSFGMMIHCLNPNVTFPDQKELLSIFDAKKVETEQMIKELIGSNFFSFYGCS